MIEGDRSLVVGGGREVGLRDAHQEFTWAEVSPVLNRAVHGLLSAGLGEHRRVAVFAENAAETVMAYVAALMAGRSAVPINFHLTVSEVAHILADSGAGLVFAGPETAARGREAAAQVGGVDVISWRCPESGGWSWEEWLARQSAVQPPDDMRPVPNLLYTSGTTGQPKGVEDPPALFAGGATVAEYVERLRKDPFNQFERHLVVGPLYHTGPLSAIRALAVGRQVSVLGRFDPVGTLEAIQRYRPEFAVMVPTHFRRLLALSAEVRARYDVSSLRMVGQTGSACPVDVKRAMIDWFGPIFYEAYGGTEVGVVAAIDSLEWLDHQGSVGRCVPRFEPLVIDDVGEELAAGREGQLYFRDLTGRGVVYHGDAEKTASAHRAPGVFTLGEVGYVDDDGYVFITDRFSDMVVSGGVNVYPAEVEKVLLQHPCVDDVAAIGVPDPDLGEVVKALVVTGGDRPVRDEELIGFCRQRLAGYKCPRSVEFVGSLPRDGMGKLHKQSLRRPYWPSERTIA